MKPSRSKHRHNSQAAQSPHLAASAAQRYRPHLAFLVPLVLWYGACDWLYRQVPDSLLAEFIYPWGINQMAADIINAISHDAHVRVDGHRLISPRATLEVVRGCDGSGLLFLMSAAIVAFSASWRPKLWGLLAAAALVYVANELRVISLYFVLANRPAWFMPLHVSVFPLVILALGAMLYLWWMHWAQAFDTDVAR